MLRTPGIENCECIGLGMTRVGRKVAVTSVRNVNPEFQRLNSFGEMCWKQSVLRVQ